MRLLQALTSDVDHALQEQQMTTPFRSKLLYLTLVLIFSVTARAYPAASHDRQFWREIARHSYSIPEGESAAALAHELSALLASPDPEMRDDLAYSILAHWILRGKLSNSELVSLSDEWRSNLKNRIGESGTDSVLLRSFSALCLSEVAAYDVKTPFLGPERYRALLSDALAYLNQERDLRGYDANLGWIHATAHTADLLRALAMNPLLAKADQAATLHAISERLASARDIYTHGEQDRLALLVVAIIMRADFDVDNFDAWMRQMQDQDRAMWNHTPIPLDEMARYQNNTYLIEAMAARLSLPSSSSMATPPAAHSSAVLHVQDTVLAAVRER